MINEEEVSIYLTTFISVNTIAEANLLPNPNQHNGRLDFMAPKEHYEVIGVNSIDTIQLDKNIDKSLCHRKKHVAGEV